MVQRDAVRASASKVAWSTGEVSRRTHPHPRYEPPRWPSHPAKATIPATAPPDQISWRACDGVSTRQGSHSPTETGPASSHPPSPVQLCECHAASWLGRSLLSRGVTTARGWLPRDEVKHVLAGAGRQRWRRFHAYCQQGRLDVAPRACRRLGPSERGRYDAGAPPGPVSFAHPTAELCRCGHV
jgi:hypothetical protein